MVPKKFTVEPAGIVVEEFTSIFSIETCRPKLSECNNEGSISETTRIKHLNIWSIIFPIFAVIGGLITNVLNHKSTLTV
jgi:hypothetical protein